jgi:hypothetical protein
MLMTLFNIILHPFAENISSMVSCCISSAQPCF